MRFNSKLTILILFTVMGFDAIALPCGPIFQKAKRLPKGGMTKTACVFQTQHPGEVRGSFISYYLCDGKTRYKLTTYEDLSCEAKIAGKND